MRIVFVNRFFYPDHSATSQLLSDLAFRLAQRGFEVNVLTSRQRYDDPSAALASESCEHGVRIHRLWTTRFGRRRLLLRSLDYLTFYLGATAKLTALADRHTVIVSETDPPLMSVPCALAAWLRGAKLVNWAQDLFPEIAQVLSVPGIAIVAPILRRLRNLSLAIADANVVLGESMATHLISEGICKAKIEIIHNWSLSESESEVAPNVDHPLRREWGLEGKFVVGYSGNFGRAHDFATILDAATLLRERPDIQFLFVGSGAQRVTIEGRVAAFGLPNVTMKPYQPLECLPISLSLPDVHLVSLKPELEGLVVPSKLYAVLAAGRGVLFVGKVDGEIARILHESDCGRAFPPSGSEDLAVAIERLADNRQEAVAMGTRARDLWARSFRRNHALERWEELLTRVCGEGSA